ncbi:MAG: hypothetical protein HY288_00805 [Planctomycetia bacterium]|nr:hypothetical protein [Planctomycetia bacterium]
MRSYSIFTAGLVGFAAWGVGPAARAQFEAPPNSVAFEDSGTLEAVQPGVLQFRDSKSEAWLLELIGTTKVTVEGEAESECLRPGLYVQLTGQIDKKGALAKEVDEIEIFSAQGKSSLGLFTEAETEPGAKPVRKAGAGTYRIKGKLASYKDGELVIMALDRKITGSTGADLKIKLNLDDPALGQAGDEVKVKAWYYDPYRPNPALNRPGKARAEEVTITLAKPLAHSGKKSRPPVKSAKPPTKAESRAVKN